MEKPRCGRPQRHVKPDAVTLIPGAIADDVDRQARKRVTGASAILACCIGESSEESSEEIGVECERASKQRLWAPELAEY